MRYIVALLLFVPFTACAQLSSENFQVDGFSVGSTQSTNAQSANFQTTRESGGQFILEEENQDDEVQSTGGGIRREINRSTSTTDDGSGSISEASGIDDPESTAAGKPSDGGSTNSNDDSGTLDGGTVRDVDAGREVLNQDEATSSTTEQSGTVRRDRIDYFWYWWPPLLLGSLCLLWFTYRRRNGDRRSY